MGEYRTTLGEQHPLPQKDLRRRRRRLLTAVGLGLAAVCAAGFLVRVPRYAPASGHVLTELHAEIRPAAAGVVREILAGSGHRAAAGEILARLDDSEEQAAFEEAQSRVMQGRAELARLQAQVAESRRMLAEQTAVAELRLKDAEARLERTKELLAKGLAAGTALDDAKLRHDLAKAELAALKARDTTLHDKEIAVLEQDVAAREDAAQKAEARLQTRLIRAPFEGLLLRYEFAVGELVRPENVLFEIFGGDKFILRLRLDERHAAKVKPGQPYTARLGPYRGLRDKEFSGRVVRLRDVIQSDGQQGYRVVYCSFDPGGPDVPPGASAEARIWYGSSCLWMFLLGLD